MERVFKAQCRFYDCRHDREYLRASFNAASFASAPEYKETRSAKGRVDQFFRQSAPVH